MAGPRCLFLFLWCLVVVSGVGWTNLPTCRGGDLQSPIESNGDSFYIESRSSSLAMTSGSQEHGRLDLKSMMARLLAPKSPMWSVREGTTGYLYTVDLPRGFLASSNVTNIEVRALKRQFLNLQGEKSSLKRPGLTTEFSLYIPLPTDADIELITVEESSKRRVAILVPKQRLLAGAIKGKLPTILYVVRHKLLRALM